MQYPEIQVPLKDLKLSLDKAQTARMCIYGHLEERNAQRLCTSSLRRRLRAHPRRSCVPTTPPGR